MRPATAVFLDIRHAFDVVYLCMLKECSLEKFEGRLPVHREAGSNYSPHAHEEVGGSMLGAIPTTLRAMSVNKRA